jgi:YD repeat-containing protein
MKISFSPARLFQNRSGLAALITISCLMTGLTGLRADVPAPVIGQFQAGGDGSVSLTWSATADSAYQVLTCTDLVAGVWSPIDYLTAGSNSVTWQANGQGGAARFYRLATEGIAVQSVEPAIVSTGAVTVLYITGQGFGSNDVVELIGPGGTLTLTNRVVISGTLMSVTVGPGFTPDVPGDYQLRVTSGSSGKQTTLSYAWTLVTPAGSRALLEPPQVPPAIPALMKAKEKANQVKCGINLGAVTGTGRGWTHDDESPKESIDLAARKSMSVIFHNDAGEESMRRGGIGLFDGSNNGRVKSNVSNNRLIGGGSGDESPTESDDPDFKRHHATQMDPFPDPPNIAESGRSRGKRALWGIGGNLNLSAGQVRGGILSSGDDVGMREAVIVKPPPHCPMALSVIVKPPPHCPSTQFFSGDERHLRDKVDAVLFSGEVQVGEADMVIPGRGLDFVWARTYRSRTAARQGMTYGWTCSYDVSVSQTTDGIAVFDGTGRSDVYHLGADGVYTRNEFFNEGRLVKNVFTLTFPDTGKWIFNPMDSSAAAGRLAQIVDANGNTITLGYDTSGRIAQIVDDLGRTNTVGYNGAGQLASVTDFSHRTVKYQYYEAKEPGGSPGDLKSVTSPAVTGTPNGNDFPDGKTTTYTYSTGFSNEAENHLLLSVSDGKGQTQCQLTYQHNAADFAFLRCIAEQDGTNAPAYMTYLPVTAAPGNNFATLKVVTRDAYGNVRETLFDSRNRPVDLREFTGRAPSPGPVTDTANRPVGKVRAADPDYYETQWSWNSDSLCTRETEPAGNAIACVYQSDFDKAANPRKRGDVRVCREIPCCADLDRDGFSELVTRYDYDPRFGSGNYGRIKVRFYWDRTGKNDAAEKGWSGTFPAGPRQTISERSFATHITDPNGNVAAASYDAHGNCVRLEEGDVPVPVITWEPRVMDFAYNGFGQLTAITNAADGNGYRSVDVIGYYTSGPESGYVSDWTVDTQGPTVIQSTYEYDPRGNLTRCVDPRTNDWLYTYNALDQLVQSSSASMSGGGGSYRIATQFTYDAADNLTQCAVENRDQTGALGTNAFWRTQYVYDQQNRLSGCWRDKNGNVVLRCTEIKYDANDNVALYRSGEAVNGNDTNKVVQFVYDERNLLFQSVRAPGATIAATNGWDYDGNRKVKLQNCPAGSTIVYRYDGFDRCIAMQDPMGNTVSNRYDASGRIKWSRSNAVDGTRLAEASFTYDALDRCVQSADLLFDVATQLPIGRGASTMTCAYAPNDDCLSVTDDNGHATRYAYDTAGRLATVTDAKTNTVSYSYDGGGNALAVTQTDHSDLGGAPQVFVTTCAYDPLNRCTSSSDNVGNTEQFFYDSRDNLVRHIDANGTLSGATYDGLNRCLATVVDMNGDGVLDFTADAGSMCAYDDNDCLLSTTDANHNPTFHTYDALDRCVVTTRADGTLYRLIWSPRSNLISETDPNGTVITNQYDLNDRCIRRDITPGPGVVASTTFETFDYDGCSRLTLASNDVSRLTYVYDSLGDCTTSTQDGLATICAFDGVGNCLSMSYPGGRVVQYAYDGLDCVTSVASSASGGQQPTTLATYSYDGPGDQASSSRKNGAIIAADFDYKEKARLARILRGNGANTRINWSGLAGVPNAAGDRGWQQVSRINHAATGNQIIDQRSFAYDSNQNKTLRAQLTEFAQGQGTLTNQWSYNPLDMMDHAINTKGTGTAGFTDYALDAVGNRIAVTNNGVTGLYTRDSASPPADFQMDQYTTTPFGSRLYDDNGNLLQVMSAAGQTGYAYDYANRLVSVYDLTTGSAVPVAGFSYDALGHRLSKTSFPPAPAASSTTYYVRGKNYRRVLLQQGRFMAGGAGDLDGDGFIAETRADGAGGAVTHVYCSCSHLRMGRPTVNTAVASFTGAGALEYYFHADDLGNVLALTDAGGNVLERYEYDDYGTPHFLTSDGTTTSATSSARGNPFLFHGMEWDAETGLYWGGGSGSGDNPTESYYDANVGRCITRGGNWCGMGVFPRAGSSSLTGNNPWSPARLRGSTKTQGDFNLSNRFSLEID